MTAALGRLLLVPVREVWTHEAHDFTPWLAIGENLALLAETLGIGELEIQGTEVPVGNFHIDILALDSEGNVVIIENQFGSTDHTHLGQIMTYTAGQEGRATIIWIAEKFREEHRAAIDWLNASTIDGFEFFAVEVEAWRIGSSLPAPRFNVMASPNDWTKAAREASGSIASSKPQLIYSAYWASFAEYLKTKKSSFSIKLPRKVPLAIFPIGRSGIAIASRISTEDLRISVELYIHHDPDGVVFGPLRAQKEAIEREVGEEIYWREPGKRQRPRIALYMDVADPADETHWPNQHAWILPRLERFRTAFVGRIRALPFSSEFEAEETPSA